MSLTIHQILTDAKRLSDKLKDDDSFADNLLSQTQAVYKQIDAMKHVCNLILFYSSILILESWFNITSSVWNNLSNAK